MIEHGAIDAIERGCPGIHIAWAGRVLEAVEVVPLGLRILIRTRHLNGEPGPTVRASEATVLRREYEPADDA